LYKEAKRVPDTIGAKIMELNYSWWMEDDFYLGYIDEYPQYPTQGENLNDLENGLKEIYRWIKDGTLKLKECL